MLDLSDLAFEAESLAAQLRGARCCDALIPCYRCSLLKFNVLARRRVIEVPKSPVRPKSRPGVLRLVAADPGLELRAS